MPSRSPRQWPFLLALSFLFVLLPAFSRYWLDWSNGFGYLSDLAIGSLLLVLVYGRPLWLGLPVMLLWSLSLLGNAELVSAVGRMPELSDLEYLVDAQFLRNSTHGGGLAHPGLALALGLGVLAAALLARRAAPLHRVWLLLPGVLLAAHAGGQIWHPSEAAQWQLFNLPHKLLAEGLSGAQLAIEERLTAGVPETPPDITGLTRLDLDGERLLPPGRARNVLIVTLEGIPGAYIAANRAAIGSSYREDLMPRLSRWAERAMSTPDYVLHAHQTIRGLYAMLCGDYDKLDSGTPKGLELLNHELRNRECLPAQLREQGFTTHFLQGAGLRFMAKDRIMPHIGFDKTLGRDWFRNQPYLEFPWGMDDKAYFEGALDYIRQLRRQDKPWMLTLLTVGTHQPYSAPDEYLARYPGAKQAAIGYLDDAVGDFLDALERLGVLEDTLVIVTSDESHGLENVRLASAWGFNLVLAPEQEHLPALKSGTYGHVDLSASVLDYFGFAVPASLAGRSLFRDYSHGRQIISYTNGLLRLHDGRTLVECDFQQICRRYASERFIAEQVRYLGRFRGREARLVSQSAALLDQSLSNGQTGQRYRFADRERIRLRDSFGNDWADNLIGAQYLELPQGTHTRVSLKVRGVQLGKDGATLLLKTKEYDRDVEALVPELPHLAPGKTLELEFGFDNLQTRKAFSFHLLGQGQGTIEILDFSVITEPLLADQSLSLDPAEESALLH